MAKVYVSLDGKSTANVGCVSQSGISIYISSAAVLIMTIYGICMPHRFDESARYFIYAFGQKEYSNDLLKSLPTYELVSAIILAVSAVLFVIFLVMSFCSCCCKVSGGVILNCFRFFAMVFLCSIVDFVFYLVCVCWIFSNWSSHYEVLNTLYTFAINIQYGVNATILITWVFICAIAPCLLKRSGCWRGFVCWLIAVILAFGIGNIWMFTDVAKRYDTIELTKSFEYVRNWSTVIYAAIIAIINAIMYFLSLVASDREHDCCACACCHK